MSMKEKTLKTMSITQQRVINTLFYFTFNEDKLLKVENLLIGA